MSEYTQAHLFGRKNRKTDIFVRLSTSIGSRGSADSVRDPRGFAVKFYTKEGNYDILMLNFPIFFIRDPKFLPDLVKG